MKRNKGEEKRWEIWKNENDPQEKTQISSESCANTNALCWRCTLGPLGQGKNNIIGKKK